MIRRGRLLEVCQLLNAKKAKYLVIGGWALALHGLIRATKDVDLLIPKKDVENARRVLDALKNLTWGIAGELEPADVADKPFTIIGDLPRVDLLTVANKVKFAEAQARALHVTIDGVRIPFVDYRTLLKTKETGRLQDRADIERLKSIKKLPKETA